MRPMHPYPTRSDKPAEPTDMKTIPMPDHYELLKLDRTFTEAGMALIRKGHNPVEMEGKWFIYWKDSELFFHRSWTGICVYVLKFVELDGGAKLVEAKANRDPVSWPRQTVDDELQREIELEQIRNLMDGFTERAAYQQSVSER